MCAVLWFIFLNQLTYGCLVDNTYPSIQQEILTLCDKYQLSAVHYQKSENEITEIQNKIHQELSQIIDYFDIYQNGRIYQLTYTKKLPSNLKDISYTPLVSSCDAVIDKIEVTSGNVLVSIGQYVSKGEMLVSNEIVTTSEDVAFVAVDGKVYAYVYHTFEASMKGKISPDTFTTLYQKISNQVKSEISDDGFIVDENVLQYIQKEGKIILKIQFTLYQNIAQKEFFNEE